MSRNTKVTFNPGECSALSKQFGDIYPYGFPFTLNPTMGCFLLQVLLIHQSVFAN